MTDGGGGSHVGGLAALVFAGVVLPAISGAVDPAAAAWFETYWPTCIVVGGIGAALFAAVVVGDNRPCPPTRQFAGQFVTTFIVTGGLPVLSESFWPTAPKPGVYVAEVLTGGLFGYLLIASLDEAARAARSDGTAGRIIGGYFKGLIFRFTGIDLTKPADETDLAKPVTPPDVVTLVVEPDPPDQPGEKPRNP